MSLRCVKAHVNGMLIVKDSMASHVSTAAFRDYGCHGARAAPRVYPPPRPKRSSPSRLGKPRKEEADGHAKGNSQKKQPA